VIFGSVAIPSAPVDRCRRRFLRTKQKKMIIETTMMAATAPPIEPRMMAHGVPALPALSPIDVSEVLVSVADGSEDEVPVIDAAVKLWDTED
jgi:hypothetical protein